MLRFSRALLISTGVVLASSQADAGNFTINWGTLTYPSGTASPTAFTLTDQYGYKIDMQLAHPGTTSTVFPIGVDTTYLGGISDIFWASDAAANGGAYGEDPKTATASFLLQGTSTAVGVNSLVLTVSDIDPTDSNTNITASGITDRCDFVTATGNNGNPTLAYVSGAPTGSTTTSVFLIGPSTGTGTSGASANYRTVFTSTAGEIARSNLNWAANQAHCLYYPSLTFTSPTSSNDAVGSLTATYPNGTSIVTLRYDEVTENARNSNTGNAAERGVGLWGNGSFSATTSISMTKSTTTTDYAVAGDSISYSYLITNTGSLPINTSQNIQISDDKIGIISCPAITTAIAVGGTFTCTGSYTATAADIAAGKVTNIATAGVGTGAMAFASRLQSATSTVTVKRRPLVSVKKVMSTGSGGPFTFAGTNLTASIASVASATTTASPVSPTKIPVTSVTTSVVLTETMGATSIPVSISCSDSNTAVSGNASGVLASSTTASVTIPTAVLQRGADILCLFTNKPTIATLSIVKTASTAGPVIVGQVYTYTFSVTNTGNVLINNVSAIESAFNGSGTAPVPGSEALFTDASPTGDSTDATSGNGTWSVLAPGDVVRFTASYTVTQTDIDTRQ